MVWLRANLDWGVVPGVERGRIEEAPVAVEVVHNRRAGRLRLVDLAGPRRRDVRRVEADAARVRPRERVGLRLVPDDVNPAIAVDVGGDDLDAAEAVPVAARKGVRVGGAPRRVGQQPEGRREAVEQRSIASVAMAPSPYLTKTMSSRPLPSTSPTTAVLPAGVQSPLQAYPAVKPFPLDCPRNGVMVRDVACKVTAAKSFTPSPLKSPTSS